jgi:co-chaperonin GroES (HSP10)
MAIKGASLYQTLGNASNIRYDIIGKTSEVIAVGDPLTISSGVLKVVSVATDPIVGVAAAASTAAQNDGTRYVAYVPTDDTQVWLMGTIADCTDNKTNGGIIYKLCTSATNTYTAPTGNVVVDITAGAQTTTAMQVMVLKVDPRGIGGSGANSGLREVLVKFVRTPSVGGIATN